MRRVDRLAHRGVERNYQQQPLRILIQQMLICSLPCKQPPTILLIVSQQEPCEQGLCGWEVRHVTDEDNFCGRGRGLETLE